MPGRQPAIHSRHPHEDLLAMVLLSGYKDHISRLEIIVMVARMRVSNSFRDILGRWKLSTFEHTLQRLCGSSLCRYHHCWQTYTWQGFGLGLWLLIYRFFLGKWWVLLSVYQ